MFSSQKYLYIMVVQCIIQIYVVSLSTGGNAICQTNALKDIYSFKCDQQFEVSEHTYLLTYRNTYYWYGINIEILTLLSIILKRKCLYCPGIPSIQLVLEILVHLFMIDLRSDEFYKRLLNSLVVECWRSRVQSPVKDRLLNSLVVVLALSASYQTL